MLVLVDSSAWVEFFLDTGHEVVHPLLQLGKEKRIATSALIRVEVLTGARDESNYRFLEQRLRELHELPLTEKVWQQAARLRWGLRRRGLVLPTVDIVIATCAMAHDCEVLHADRHFDLIARHAPLRIYKPKRASIA